MKEKLNEFAKAKIPCFFIVDFHKKAWHVESLENPTGEYLFRFSYPKDRKALHVKDKIPISKKRYSEAFDKVREELKDGNTYLLNLTFPTSIKLDISLKDIFLHANAPFCCLKKDEFVCFSPERFVKIEDNHIDTFPMKGTIDASIKDAKDLILKDKKEMAEHAMVVDLMRNDLSMVSKNVRVMNLRYTQKIQAGDKELLQVSSHIRGDLDEDWHERLADIFDTLLPAGSISGTPKYNTLKIIDEVEGYERGFYSGVFGVYDGKSVDSAVMIRFIQKDKNGFIYKSGGGITIDSDEEKEYKEMLDKVYVPML